MVTMCASTCNCLCLLPRLWQRRQAKEGLVIVVSSPSLDTMAACPAASGVGKPPSPEGRHGVDTYEMMHYTFSYFVDVASSNFDSFSNSNSNSSPVTVMPLPTYNYYPTTFQMTICRCRLFMKSWLYRRRWLSAGDLDFPKELYYTIYVKHIYKVNKTQAKKGADTHVPFY